MLLSTLAIFLETRWRSPVEANLSASSQLSSSGLTNILTNDGVWWSQYNAQSAWVKLIFTDYVVVTGFRTKSRFSNDAFRRFVFQTSPAGNGSSWSTVLEGEGEEVECCVWQEFLFAPRAVTSNMFVLKMVSNWGGAYFSLQQLELCFLSYGRYRVTKS